MRADIDAVTGATSEPYGVNVFVSGVAAEPHVVARHLDSIAADGAGRAAAQEDGGDAPSLEMPLSEDARS